MDWVRFSILTDAEYKAIDETDNITRLSQSLWEYSVDRERLLPMFCEKLNMLTVN